MKKLILVGLLLVSWVWGKSVEQVQGGWWEQWVATKMQEVEQRVAARMQEWQAKNQQNEEVIRLFQHCFQAKDKGACERAFNIFDKQCDNGSAVICGLFAVSYANGEDEEQMGIKADLKKAQSYADKVCAMDAAICANLSWTFKNIKLSLKCAEKACEMGELSSCFVAGVIFSNGGDGVDKNPQKVKYYTDKLCKGGVSEACGK